MQGVEHRDALRSHWSNSLSSSSPLGPPSSTENNRHVGFAINTLAWTNQQREGEGQQVLVSAVPACSVHHPPPKNNNRYVGFAINTLARTNQQRAGRGNRCYSLSSSILLHPPSSTKTITQLCWLCDKHTSLGQSAEKGRGFYRGWIIVMRSGHIDPTASAVSARSVHHPPLEKNRYDNFQ